jgi:hypothetical protein
VDGVCQFLGDLEELFWFLFNFTFSDQKTITSNPAHKNTDAIFFSALLSFEILGLLRVFLERKECF